MRALYINITENGSISNAFEPDDSVRMINQLLEVGALEQINKHDITYSDGRVKNIFSLRRIKHPIWNRLWWDTVQAIGFAPTNPANDCA